jgi:hypothetical protein
MDLHCKTDGLRNRTDIAHLPKCWKTDTLLHGIIKLIHLLHDRIWNMNIGNKENQVLGNC